MKKYNIDCHYDVVVTVEVTAESEEQAREAARNISTPQGYLYPGTNRRALYSRTEKVGYTQTITAKESARRKREAVMEYVRMVVNDSDLTKKELAEFAFTAEGHAYGWNWAEGCDMAEEDQPWKESLFMGISECTDPRTALYDRYAKWAARLAFRRRFNYHRSDYEARHLDTLSKQQQKQATHEALDTLDRLTLDCITDEDTNGTTTDCQMIMRYTNRDNRNDYWNLFIYCEGPNDNGDGDELSYFGAWQHCNDDTDDIDDFGTEHWHDRKALFRDRFYIENDIMPEGWDAEQYTLTTIWVDGYK